LNYWLYNGLTPPLDSQQAVTLECPLLLHLKATIEVINVGKNTAGNAQATSKG